MDGKIFDQNFIKELISDFTFSTGIGCFLMSNKGEMLLDSWPDTKKCEYCRLIGSLCGKDTSCSRYHLYGVNEAKRLSGDYVYFCPSGLAHFACPVILDGEVLFSLIGGPVLIVDNEDFLLRDVLQINHIPEEYEDQVESYMLKNIVSSPERLSALSRTLNIFAAKIALNEKSRLDKETSLSDDHDILQKFIRSLRLVTGNTRLSLPFPVGEETKLMSALSDGNREEAMLILDSLCEEVLALPFENNFENFFHLILLLSRAALEGGGELSDILSLNLRYLKESKELSSPDEFSALFKRETDGFFSIIFGFHDVKHTDVILKAINFMKNNYMKKLSLDDVAAQVYLSPSYLSKIFKEDTGQNLNFYLNTIRIEKSKNFLLSSSLNLSEISERCGFEDQSYFSKVFKKAVGQSPGRFRETRGKIAVAV